MLLVITMLAAAAGAAPQKPAEAPKHAAPVCQEVGVHKADMVAKDLQPGAHKLTKEPPADVVKAVLYTEGGCVKPIVVRKGVPTPP